jgi:hypothetical protein
MRDDASRARLVEMGFELYMPRGGLLDAAAAAPAPARRRVALVARGEGGSGRTLVAEVVRALAYARIDAAVVSDGARIGEAAGIVVFGAALAREVGASLPAARRQTIAWAGVAEPAEIAGKAAAKRALWGELKRLARSLAGA